MKIGTTVSILLAVVPTVALVAQELGSHSQRHPTLASSSWSRLMDNMATMHAAMASVEPSVDDDMSFVSLMLPHHQAALDMARTELLFGTDPQVRRLAQEIVTDQQSEIALMQLWLRTHQIERRR